MHGAPSLASQPRMCGDWRRARQHPRVLAPALINLPFPSQPARPPPKADRTNLALASGPLIRQLGLSAQSYGLAASLFSVPYAVMQVRWAASS